MHSALHGGSALVESRDGIFIIVPAYNEGRQIEGVVRDLLTVSPNVVVIDDGSDDGTGSIAEVAGARVLRHVFNRGQGASIQTGLEWALQRGAQFVVTFDSDGQHLAEDLPRLLEPVMRGECDIALGSRFLGTAVGLTTARRILLRSATLFTRLVSGLRVTDAHNGLRAFNRRAAAAMHLRLDRMAHASEVLDQIRRNGLSHREVAVHIRYTEYSRSKGQRSFAAFRILFDYLLNRWTR